MDIGSMDTHYMYLKQTRTRDPNLHTGSEGSLSAEETSI